VEIYTDDLDPVNGRVEEIELPAFLTRRRPHVASSKPRRRIRPETWSSINAAIVRQHQALPADSPRIKPSLPRLRWLERAVEAA
jgi:hypothetical protein